MSDMNIGFWLFAGWVMIGWVSSTQVMFLLTERAASEFKSARDLLRLLLAFSLSIMAIPLFMALGPLGIFIAVGLEHRLKKRGEAQK